MKFSQCIYLFCILLFTLGDVCQAKDTISENKDNPFIDGKLDAEINQFTGAVYKNDRALTDAEVVILVEKYNRLQDQLHKKKEILNDEMEEMFSELQELREKRDAILAEQLQSEHTTTAIEREIAERVEEIRSMDEELLSLRRESERTQLASEKRISHLSKRGSANRVEL